MENCCDALDLAESSQTSGIEKTIFDLEKVSL